MSRYQVLVSDKRHVSYDIERDLLSGCDAELVIANCKTEQDMINVCKNADGILLDMAPMTQGVVAVLEKCKIISRYGVGYDNVDVEACTRKGIKVANVPDYCEEDVSDHTLALLFSCIRQIPFRDRRIRNGEWNIYYPNTFRVKGKNLSILGFGRIAQALARKVSGLGLANIFVYDPYVDENKIVAMGGRKVNLRTAIVEADYLTLHMPVTDETRGMVNSAFLSLMKPSAILINTARGALVDDEALISALKEKRIAFAGIDTHNSEPITADNPYLALENCILTDHTGFNTEESVIELKTKAAQNICDMLNNRKPKYLIN